VDNIRTLFVSLYGEQLKKPHTTIVECHGFDEYYDQQMRALEQSGASVNQRAPVPTDGVASGNIGDEPPLPSGLRHRGHGVHDETTPASSPVATPNSSRPGTPNKNLLLPKGPVGKMSRRQRKMHNNSAPVSSGDELPHRKAKAARGVKKGRKWDADGLADEADDVQLDYSAPAHHAAGSDSDGEVARSSALEHIDSATWGSKTARGQFVLKDLDNEIESMLASASTKSAQTTTGPSSTLLGSGINTISSLFRNVVGGKVLTKQDLEQAMKGMQEHLLKKNVANEAAVRLCEGVEKELIGIKTGSFESRFALFIYLSVSD
jgi:signal recognition particle receptor subunit alpha